VSARAIAALLALMPAMARAEAPKLTPPVTPACISSPFGWRHAVGPLTPAGMHNGVDLPAPPGGFVHAVAPGHIVKIERMGIGGLQIIIAHDGFSTLYAHLGTVMPRIAEGERTVAQGEAIARVGHTGVSYGPHLFFEVLVDGKPVDPTLMLPMPHC
jgi:murein DD-endopeptidase MepM/ murein hydrolase activator NlpD